MSWNPAGQVRVRDRDTFHHHALPLEHRSFLSHSASLSLFLKSCKLFAVAVTEGFRQPFHTATHSGRLDFHRSETSTYQSPSEGDSHTTESSSTTAVSPVNSTATTPASSYAIGSDDHRRGSYHQDREDEFAQQRGQWSGPRNHQRAGDQDPMSQKEPASGSTSPASQQQQQQQQLGQKSPTSGATPSRVSSVSPRNTAEELAAAREAHRSAAAAAAVAEAGVAEFQHQQYHRHRHSLGTPTTNGQRVQPSPQRSSLGVHHILNPSSSEAAHTSSGGRPDTPTSATARSIEDERIGGQYPAVVVNGKAIACLFDAPFPAMGAATRRILTPQSPRALGMGGRSLPPNRPLMSSPTPLLHHQPPPPSSSGPEMRRHLSTDSFADHRSSYGHGGHQHPHQHHPLAPRNPPLHNVPTTRSLSQPAAGAQSPSDNRQQQQHQHQFPGGDPRYGGAAGYGTPRAIPVPEGQLAFRIAPVNGEAFTIPVDTHQASRASDEKRQRNAGASARFRLRKKEREQQQVINLHKLQQDNADMQKRLQELEAIETERNRLRDIVWRAQQQQGGGGATTTADSSSSGGYHHHQRPPSPTRRRPADSLLGGGVPPPPPLPSGAYGVGDPTTGERPSRRRRTDSGMSLDYSSTAAAPPSSSQHPPHHITLPGPLNYPASLSQPGTPTGLQPINNTNNTRLPPLRMDHHQGYSPYKREPYESGWAVRPPGGPHDPSQKGA
ncbi:uncharacterized protein PG998_005950 [Apiospora kogelbergensis]|uniref:uncharacterized protein n=1 Tax=Apiospora kogelbergensis TaxID=1337665 RepID=UPI00312F484C